ncbi:5-formyltetrahydrofolate cyclo-ligase family protein [Symmachiella macrocystis]|uniref:5-formyltetrahydrofolate cyclo-ligase n=1 Tax=Symmachiella macrocystis TaxID=2527985 RepID=A0A5C6BJ06_9PLAN|nr:5-formyltetrahydrofolate cyclo-ligase [Symmachiella macrocystis]TWU12000.1 5-formyltetrahydrofolate cyclo-ligase family protein [Symmachiella macrocystis]
MSAPTPITKPQIRQQARDARQALDNRHARSQQITDHLHTLPEYQSAHTVMLYVSVREEVATADLINAALETDKQVVIPYCHDGELQLFHLKNRDELTPGAYGIPEPHSELRTQPDRSAATDQLDIILVPGVAFDIHGARCGHGKGYYDKLLQTAKSKTPLIALAFDCQIFRKIPTESHDVFMDKIITESRIYPEA